MDRSKGIHFDELYFQWERSPAHWDEHDRKVQQHLFETSPRFSLYWQRVSWWGCIKKKWDRISSLVDSKFSISSEGANLSGLEEEPTEIEKLVLDMLKERYETAKAKDEQKAKDKIRNEKMLTHERSILLRQDRWRWGLRFFRVIRFQWCIEWQKHNINGKQTQSAKEEEIT